ncbi:MAG TPA: LytTR family DNA-binding domain-containing protein [Niabella sp.]|mgnify:CR=1 FL=1|nr:LytTR family DNA-binding domain-containing protein [Niabella sp.]HOZ95748.1 LytTR family DNA-binding domain-containing protein [Niabella sp.]HQW13602.1 LytTR family DNA-binding domain-containing protein [Niabella sp.]HQX18996.1 LytTR family DNA-binding domain-containing protein [Niabella sp.]HRB06287.1 LytTR family DNA-binding domain-containing protein [Niabella sp.]
MIRTIIIDDEQNCIDSLAFDLRKHCPAIEIVDTCISSKQGIHSIKNHHPELVFLDVQMPWMTGFEMLDMLGKIDFAIIFTTAYDQFASKAFRLSAIDYLLKPIELNELKEAVNKASEKIIQKLGQSNIDNLLHNINQSEVNHRVAFASREGYEFIEISSIEFAQAEGAYTHVFLQSKRKLVISKTLSDIEEMLPTKIFQRIHHSTLVNLKHVKHFVKSDGGYVIMDCGEKLSVSKSKKDDLTQRLGLI